MIFSLASQSSQPSIKVHLGDTILEQVISYKYLGIDFDHKLSFASQTTRAVTKAKQGIGALCRTLRKWSSSKILNTAISSIAMPALLYGIETWFPPDVTKQIQVLKLQKYAARLLLNNFKEEISLVDLVNQVKWQPIHHIVATRRLLALRKYLEGTRYIDSEVFPLQIPESGIRKSSRLLERKYTNSIQRGEAGSRPDTKNVERARRRCSEIQRKRFCLQNKGQRGDWKTREQRGTQGLS